MLEDSNPSTTPHEHHWRMTLHMDGCHWYASTFVCECGAQRETWDERDIKSDPYSMVWMDDGCGDDPCVRCEELIAGDEPVHRVTGDPKP